MFHFAACSISFVKFYVMNSEARSHDQNAEFFVANFALTYSLYCRYDIFLRILAETVKKLTLSELLQRCVPSFPSLHTSIKSSTASDYMQITSEICIPV